MGRQIRPMWPLYDAFTIAEQIVELVRHPKPEAFAGQIGSLITLVSTLLTLSLVEHLVRTTIDFVQVSKSESAPTLGNLMEPDVMSAAVSGGWRSGQKRSTQKAAVGLMLGLSLGIACSVGLRRTGLWNRVAIDALRGAIGRERPA